MQLDALTAEFVSLSGRNDLSLAPVDNNSPFNTRAEFFINNAIDWLDEHVEVSRQTKHYSIDTVAGEPQIMLPNPISVDCVYCQENNSQGWEVEEKKYSWVRHNYPEVLSTASTGAPAYWSWGITDLAPQQSALTASNYTDEFTYEFGDTLFANEVASLPGTVGRYRSRSILILPPPDKVYTITFVGKFYSKFLANATDTNMWTERRPQLVLKTCLMVLEGFYRNSTGYADWQAQVMDEIHGMNTVQSHKEVGDGMRMEG